MFSITREINKCTTTKFTFVNTTVKMRLQMTLFDTVIATNEIIKGTILF